MWAVQKELQLAAKRLIAAAAANQAQAVEAEERHAAPNVVGAAARAAAAAGAVDSLQVLLARHTAASLSVVPPHQHALETEIANAVNAASPGQPGDRLLLSQPPLVIAACRLHPDAVAVLLQAGAHLPPTVGGASGSVPLLAYWSSRLPDGSANQPAALAVLEQLLAAGADPLAAGNHQQQHRPDIATRGRTGTCCSFLLTCRCPVLLGAGVRHVLRQCAAEQGGRELRRHEVAVVLVAARLAGLGEEAEQLLAQASLVPCFPPAHGSEGRGEEAPGQRRRAAAIPRRAAATVDKRRRLLARAFDVEWEGAEEEDDMWSEEVMEAAAAASSSDEESGSDGAGVEEHTDGEAEDVAGGEQQPAGASPAGGAGAGPSLAPQQPRRLTVQERRAAFRRHQAQLADPDAPSTSAAAARSPCAVWHRAVLGPARRPLSPGGERAGGDSHRRLQAQLVADCASHNLLDVLRLLLSQGASPAQPVPWEHVGDESPAAVAAREAHEHVVVPGFQRPPLALAAAAGHAGAVAALVRHGAPLDLETLLHAVWSLNADGVEALLRCMPRSQLPPSVPSSYAESSLNCPILLLLLRHQEVAVRAAADAAVAALPQDVPFYRFNLMLLARTVLSPSPSWQPAGAAGEGVAAAALAAARARAAPHLARLEARALRILDLLHGAGYRVHVFKDHCGVCSDGIWRMGRVVGLQPRELELLDVAGRNRVLWQSYCRAEWSPASHATFPPAFRAAAKTLLLAASYGEQHQAAADEGSASCSAVDAEASNEVDPEASAPAPEPSPAAPSRSAGAVAAAGLAMLPQELVRKILADAAYPLSAWVPE